MNATKRRIGLARVTIGLCLLAPWTIRSQSTGCVPPPPGLVSWWRGQSTTLDNTGTNHAVSVGGVRFGAGEVGQGFLISGTGDDYVELPTNIFPMPTTGEGFVAFSFEVWFKTSDSGVILGQQDTAPFVPAVNGNVPALYVGTNGILYASLFWSGGTQLQTPAQVNDGRFHHVVVTYDGNTEILYLDGAWVAATPFVQQGYADNYWYELGTGWTDGWPDTPGGWSPFIGVIDEASLYERALLPDEVASLFGAGTAGKCTQGGGPLMLHRYSFNGPVGSKVIADSVGGANGTLYFYSSTAPYTNGAPDGSSLTGTGQLNLNGGNAYVKLPSGLISSLSNVTFETWIDWRGTSSTSVWQRIFDFGYSDAGDNASGFGTNYLILTPSRGGTESFGFEQTTVNPFGSVQDTNALILNGPGPLPIGRDVYLAVTYDPIAGQSRLYLDGALVATATGSYNPLSKILDRNNWLGRSQWQRDPFFNGLFTEFRIWEGVLGPADVANHYASGPDQPFMVPRPWLQVARAGSFVSIYWPTNNAAGFQLETTTDAVSSTWSAVTNIPSMLNNSFRVTLPAGSAPAYFRLKK